MATKKYQIFVSSTFRDLVDERQDTIRNILDLNHIPAGMELFPAADVEQLTYIKKIIDECDYYLLIVGGRYGSLDTAGVSFTEREYDYAVETGKFVIAFVHGEPDEISVKNTDLDPELVEALKNFRQKVMEGRLVKPWTNRQDLQLAVLKSLMHAFSAYPQIGWIRGDAAASDRVLEQSNKALQDNAALREEIGRLKSAESIKHENLADLDEKITVRYQHYARYRAGPGRYEDTSIELTWRQIFLSLASKLSTPKTEGVITQAIKIAAKEKDVEGLSYLNQTDIATIKVQLAALGLITLRVSKTTEGGTAEFISLTEQGRQAFISDKIIKTKAGRSPDDPQQ